MKVYTDPALELISLPLTVLVYVPLPTGIRILADEIEINQWDHTARYTTWRLFRQCLIAILYALRLRIFLQSPTYAGKSDSISTYRRSIYRYNPRLGPVTVSPIKLYRAPTDIAGADWMIYPRVKRNSEIPVIRSNSPRGNIKVYTDMLITSSSRTQWRMSQNMSLIGKTSSRKLYSYIWGDELMKGSLLNMGFSLYTRKHSMRS